MKLKKTILSVFACAIALVMTFGLAACGNGEETENKPKATSITLDEEALSVATGETARLAVTATYDNQTTSAVSAGDVEWTSSAENVATVTRGVVSGKSSGSATVTAKLGDCTAKCEVTVYSLVVELSKGTASIEMGESEQLTATVKKDGVEQADEAIEWTTDNDSVVTVDQTGLVKAWKEGTANVTAKRKNGPQSATCKVTVIWENKGENVQTQISNTEQNKVQPNSWGYWADLGSWEFGNTRVDNMYTEDYTVDVSGYTPAAEGNTVTPLNTKVTLDFTVLDHNGRSGESNPYAQVQLAFRSAKNDSEAGANGLLLTNHNYKLTFKFNSTTAGDIKVNPISPDCDEPIAVVKGENTISVNFRHGDWGVIYPTSGDDAYTNVESAIFLQLGDLALTERTLISIYDIIWEDLGESEEKTIMPDFTPKPVVLPDLSGVEAVALDIASNNEDMYAVTSEDEGKSYNVVYTNTVGESYTNLVVSLDGKNAEQCNTFAVTIKNNGEEDMRIRFDINGSTPHGENNVIDIVKSSVASEGTPVTNLEWGGTDLNVAAGATVTLYLTYDASTESGAPVSLMIYFHTHVYQDSGNNHSGSVTLSDFKFANVTE